jgi:hypothetical protein
MNSDVHNDEKVMLLLLFKAINYQINYYYQGGALRKKLYFATLPNRPLEVLKRSGISTVGTRSTVSGGSVFWSINSENPLAWKVSPVAR